MSREDIGRTGEALAHVIMTELCGREEPYFRPWFLDSKFPTFDYLVYLIDHPTCYFFVQVRTTNEGYTVGPPPRLKVQVESEDVGKMAAHPAPAYVLGIDLTGKLGFWLSMNEPRDHVASLTTAFPADCQSLAVLEAEVKAFWNNRDMVLRGSAFRE